jgi:glycerophosphoryl diester phosphodiesterase
VRLRAEGGRIVRIAHRGVPGVASENSLAGIEAALAHEVDVVEVDVSERDGALVLAHAAADARSDSPRLREALVFFADRSPAEVGIQLDLKVRGAEEHIVDELRSHSLLDRALVSSTFADVLQTVRRLEPAIPTGLAYPYDRAGIAERGLVPDHLMRAALAVMRLVVPQRVVPTARAAQVDVLLLHHLAASSRAVSRCHACGIAVYAWTVNHREELDRVLAFGVDGVVTDDPRLLEDK